MLQDTGSRENHGCDGLTASRKQPAYDWKNQEKQYKIEKMAYAGGRKGSE
jgi:hypothetical protein